MRKAFYGSVGDSIEWAERLCRKSELLFHESRVLRDDSNRIRAASEALKLQRRSPVAGPRVRRT